MGQNEDYSLEASQKALGNCSEAVVGKILYMILVKGVVHAVKHTFWQRLAASHVEQMSPLMISVLF